MKKTNRFLAATFIIFLSCFSVANAETFTVTKIADTDDGVCDADCSLREALNAANTSKTDDVVEFASPLFDSPQTITLNGTQLETLPGNGALTINGPGANLLTIDADNKSRVLSTAGPSKIISGIRFVNGFLPVNLQSGAGIDNGGRLLLSEVIVENNTCNGNNGGGGIDAGGILTIINSTIRDNVSTAGGGGGISRAGATLLIISSTISGNRSDSFGGGIDSGGTGGSGTFINSTIVNNFATDSGGGIRSPNYRMRNTLVANNSAQNLPDIEGRVNSEGHNLIEDTVGIVVNGDETGNIYGQDPRLGPLADNGGPTPTHRLLPGSPAIDNGAVATIPELQRLSEYEQEFLRQLGEEEEIVIDQRGLPRPVEIAFWGNAKTGNASDIGAFESQGDSLSIELDTVGGRVTDGIGRPIPRAIVEIQEGHFARQVVRTNHFGRFIYTQIPEDGVATFRVFSKEYLFTPVLINFGESQSKKRKTRKE